MKTKGQMIASIRKQKGLTQQQLSDLTKIPIGSIKQYETDKRNPKFETVKAIADALEINVFDLIQDVESIRKDAESFDSLPEDCRPEETTFGERLKAIRKEKGFTQKSLGLACGLKESSAESTIRKYEIGSRKPRDKALEKLANVLECDKYELWTGTPSLSKYSFQELWEEIGRRLQKVTC